MTKCLKTLKGNVFLFFFYYLFADAQSSGCKHIVVFQHIPWFLKTPEEDNDYFNTDLSKRTPMLKKLHEAGKGIDSVTFVVDDSGEHKAKL